MENVKNFKGHNGGDTYNRVREELKGLGYSVCTKVLNTAEYTNIPQNRERTFMVCFHGEKWINHQFGEYSGSELTKLPMKRK